MNKRNRDMNGDRSVARYNPGVIISNTANYRRYMQIWSLEIWEDLESASRV